MLRLTTLGIEPDPAFVGLQNDPRMIEVYRRIGLVE
jgi:hypothetical protein